MQEIMTNEQLDHALSQKKAILFKHSLTCPISAHAYQEMQEFTAAHKDAPFYIIKIQDARQVSNTIAERTGVKHESPQVIVLEKGKPVWHASHFDITAAELHRQLS